MCVFAGGMWRGVGGVCCGLSESAFTPSLSSRSTASHLSPAPWPAACRQALANLTLLPLLPFFFLFLLHFLPGCLPQPARQQGLTTILTL